MKWPVNYFNPEETEADLECMMHSFLFTYFCNVSRFALNRWRLQLRKAPPFQKGYLRTSLALRKVLEHLECQWGWADASNKAHRRTFMSCLCTTWPSPWWNLLFLTPKLLSTLPWYLQKVWGSSAPWLGYAFLTIS